MRHVVLCGFKGSGKNTFGRRLVEAHNYVGISYADALKDSLASILCWPREMLEGVTSESREWRETVDTWWSEKLNIPNFTPRYAMQYFGTDIMRKHFNAEIWILNVERRIFSLSKNRPVVVFDGRFKNEIELVKRLVGDTVRVRRGADPPWMDIAKAANEGDDKARDYLQNTFNVHESEWRWIGIPMDMTVDNDHSVSRLHQKVDEWIREKT